MSNAVTFDLEDGNSFAVELTNDVSSISIQNPPSDGVYGQFSVVLYQDATGGRTVTGWPVGVEWPGGTAPVMSSGKDKIVLSTFDGGATWQGNFGQDYS